MSDFISKEELKDYLEKNISFGGVERKFEFYDIIDSIPSADIMECARAIKSFCGKQQYKCASCKFQLFDEEVGVSVCGLEVTTPLGWDLPEGEKGGNDDNT